MPIRVGGSSSAGVTGNGTPNFIPVWVTATELGDSVMHQVVTSIVIGVDPAPAATEKLRFSGGLISDTAPGDQNFVAGQAAQAASVAQARNVVIGFQAYANAGAASQMNVAIGYNAAVGTNRDSCVVVGAQSFIQGPDIGAATLLGSSISTGVNGFSGVAVGSGLSVQGTGVIIGNQASVSNFNSYVMVGRNTRGNDRTTTLGDSAQANHAASIVIGFDGRSIAANSLVIGSNNNPITTVLIGEGDTKTLFAGVSYRSTNGSGVDDPGGPRNVTASLGTGNSFGGHMRWFNGTPGASSAVIQTARLAWALYGGTTRPIAQLSTIDRTAMASSLSGGTSGLGLQVVETTSLLRLLGTTGISHIMTKINGTFAAPTALALNDVWGNLSWQGFGATQIRPGPVLQSRATQAWTDAVSGSQLEISIVPNGTTANRLAITVTEQGKLEIAQPAGGGAAPYVNFVNPTDGAAANALVILNAPSANVLKYIPAQFNGAAGWLLFQPA